ncbi:MAG: hypothetical protein ACR2PZ_26225 [Pseudomonadales bacterium]
MITHLGDSLGFLAGTLALKLAPQSDSDYSAAQLGLISGLLLALAQESERAVATRLADIDEIRELLPEDGLPAEPLSLHLQDVTKLHAEALQKLIELHTWAEQHDPALNDAIWAFLRRSAERHAYNLPGV